MAKRVKRNYYCSCGRIRPAARKWCYTCRPKYSRFDAINLDAEYTLAERVAIARACDLSYGKAMAIMESGAQPPLIRAVEWPEGSVHGNE